MKHYPILLSRIAVSMAGLFIISCGRQTAPLAKMEAVDFSHVHIEDNFWSPRLERHTTATQPVCIDQIENQTGRMQNFRNAATGEGTHSGIYYDDSDVYKALEGIAYSLINHPDSALERRADEWIDNMAAAQCEDGYLNTYFILKGLENRWTDMERHEMYCAGHMTEAAVAYYQATGKRKLLDVSIRMADHMMSIFGPGKRHWVPGHEEIELALVKLYRVTGEQKYLDFAAWLLEERGHGYGTHGDDRPWNAPLYQDSLPVASLTKISGHAVRSMYLYCGMADVAALRGDTAYISTLHRLWDDVVLRNMYITGGIGSSRHNEGFTEDYDLPNLDAYCETCASVGMVLWNARMNRLTGNAKYIDVLERSLYNGVLAGISLAGDRFFYVNPLESLGDHHRKAWYGCACCPSQITRFLPSIGNYIYALSDDAIWINLFIGNTTQTTIDGGDVTFHIDTEYPWQGVVRFKVEADKRVKRDLRIRIPAWCHAYQLTLNHAAVEFTMEAGYAVVRRWNPGDELVLTMEMPVEVIAADPRVKADIGKRALQRGPLVYCIEAADNAQMEDIHLAPSSEYTVVSVPDKLDGIYQIEALTENRRALFIPYYAWDNREPGPMKVWVDYTE